jgi:peptidase E
MRQACLFRDRRRCGCPQGSPRVVSVAQVVCQGACQDAAVRILATSGGFLPSDYGPFQWRRGPLVEHAIELAGAPANARICHVGTAHGDSVNGIAGFYRAFAGSDVRASHLELFSMPNVPDVRAHLLAQDVVWVGGGSVANLLAVWRVHGLDDIFRECWEAGVVLAGVSAGSICWHVGGTTDSFGPRLRAVTNGLGFLPYGNGVHYDSEAERRPLLHRLVGDGTLPTSYATDDGVGLVYEGTELVEAVADRPGVAAYRVERDAGCAVTETRIEPRRLPAGD